LKILTKTKIMNRDEKIAGWTLGRIYPTPSRVPEGWELVTLTDVAQLETGHTPSRENDQYWKGNIPWLSLHDTKHLDGLTITETQQTIGPMGLANSSARLLPEGTVVFSRTATVGKATILGREMSTSQDFANYICGDNLHNEYLVHLFRFMKPEWKRLMAGSTHSSIYMEVFRNLQILLPPLKEQQEIAEKLSDVDSLIASLDALIAKKRNVKTATMQRLLTGQERLPGFEGEWRDRELGEVVKIVNGGTPDSENKNYWGGDIQWCTPTDITKTSGKYLGETERQITKPGLSSCSASLLPAGALLLCSRATIGEVKIASQEIATNQGLKSIICYNQIDNEFLYYTLLTKKEEMIKRAYGSTFLEMPKKAVASLPISLPSLEEQRAIARVLADMDAEMAALEKRREKTKAVKTGMMQELLTGKTRLQETSAVAS
jgi:type I restriction enzyme S subunit